MASVDGVWRCFAEAFSYSCIRLSSGYYSALTLFQPRNQGGAEFFAPLEKCYGHSLKLLDIV